MVVCDVFLGAHGKKEASEAIAGEKQVKNMSLLLCLASNRAEWSVPESHHPLACGARDEWPPMCSFSTSIAQRIPILIHVFFWKPSPDQNEMEKPLFQSQPLFLLGIWASRPTPEFHGFILQASQKPPIRNKQQVENGPERKSTFSHAMDPSM